jgi:hypothetical protein
MMTMQPAGKAALLLLGAALIARGATADAQNVPTRQLNKPEAEYAEPFTAVGAVRELKDGRVIVSDPRDKIVQLIDLKSGRATKVGREGQGPGEFSLPMGLVALPGDTTGIFDPLNQRYLLVMPDGKTGGFVSTRPVGDDDERGGAGGGPVVRMGGFGMTPPRGTDRSGFVYVQGSPFQMGPTGPVAQDSVPVMRFDRRKQTYEPVAYVRMPKGNAQVSGNSGNMMVRIGSANPFAARDEWAVAPDGRIAIVRADEYRVDWVSPNGQRTRGPVTPYTRTRVSDKHKKWWQESQRRRGQAMMVTNENGRTSASVRPPQGAPEERNDWPEYFPPFLGSGVQAAPNGHVWVLQAIASDDDTPTYDVFDGSGKLAQRVQIPKRSRVVGFGNGSVYVAKYDEDDLQYLQRFKLP